MTAIVIHDIETHETIHRIDTTNLDRRAREKAFMGVAMQTDFDRYYIAEEGEGGTTDRGSDDA
ncbi:MAG: hypothetical protein J0I33_07675 [Microbacterium ginsengisoli]|jgi:hypothetical protein|uniref:hypothetical protein n=1 Tax=Microbacterium TaxID=33882 RepID=UPI0006F9E11C|nr:MULTISPECIES: hypothetical protein [unclassified Microbacterium]KQR97678.1 hypothetical protein ASF93_13190 [Microbacterium sp. Leaf347]KQS01703.1 hypothetical protein ASG00_09705 [Microbacterium sp. Leaf351]MBN9198503.1 hypothetical protein [Microbacterium ginsengisoli]OJU78111.1 MAG: hypothetical protein BGO15_02610 [Microbacterium sp. 71-23]